MKDIPKIVGVNLLQCLPNNPLQLQYTYNLRILNDQQFPYIKMIVFDPSLFDNLILQSGSCLHNDYIKILCRSEWLRYLYQTCQTSFSNLEMCEEIMPHIPGAAYNRVRLIKGIFWY